MLQICIPLNLFVFTKRLLPGGCRSPCLLQQQTAELVFAIQKNNSAFSSLNSGAY